MATISYASRDNAGDPLSMGDWTGTWSYGYDDNNRLTSATAPNPVPDQPAGGIYGYDWVGNRLNPPTGTNHMVYNAADQLTSWPGMHTYTYYGDGSLNQVKDSSGTNVLRSYTCTPDGLLSTASYNSRTLANTWDASKNRVSYTVGGTTHTFVYDATAGIPAVIDEDGVYYIREPGGSLIARISGSDTSYYHFDDLGSTRLLTDSSGAVTDRYAYDAYGSLIMHDEFTGHVDQPYQYVGQLGYYTHYQEPEFGLLQLGVRFYDAQVGMFTQQDQLSCDGSVGLYAYSTDNPLFFVDPTGYFCFKGGCTGSGASKKCKSCWGTSCRGDKECPPRKKSRPKPTKPLPIPQPSVNPAPWSEAPSVCEMAPGAACGKLSTELKNLEVAYNEGRVSDEFYYKRKAQLEKAIKACSKYYQESD